MKINTTEYQANLSDYNRPQLLNVYPGKDVVFTDDRAGAHAATANQARLKAKFAKTPGQHHEWAASSYDPSPCD